MCCCSCYAFLRERGGGEMGGREMERERERDTHRERERERERERDRFGLCCLNQTCFIPSTIKDEIIQKVIKTAIFVAIANNTLYGSKLSFFYAKNH